MSLGDPVDYSYIPLLLQHESPLAPPSHHLHSQHTRDAEVATTSTNVHLILPPNQSPLLSNGIPNTKVASAQLELHLLALPSLEHHLLEPAELAHRFVGRGWELDVKLRYLCSRYSSGVANGGADGGDSVPEIFASANGPGTLGVRVAEQCGVSGDGEAGGVVECRVREAESEFVVHGCVRAVKMFVVDVVAFCELYLGCFADGEVSIVRLVLRKRMYKPTARVDVAEEVGGDGVAGGLA
jgi:hypothetical protein